MKTLLLAVTFALSASTVWADGGATMNTGDAMQNAAQDSMPAIPAMTPAMRRALMREARRLAAAQAARAGEDTSNARIQNTQRQQ
ncbi:MAG: hypothetical protein ACPGSM_12370 [Thiolinea sp.]